MMVEQNARQALNIADRGFVMVTGENILGFKIIGSRISGIFGSELILGSYLIKSLPFIIWLFFYTNLSISENKYFIVIFLSLYFIIIFIS